MAPKRKMEITMIDENERTLYSVFQNAANTLSQLYALSLNQQKLAFESGQNFAMLKMHEWINQKLQEGKVVTVSEILAYLQAKLSDWVSDVALPEQGASGSGQNSTSAEVATASSAPKEQDGDPEMQMD